MQRLSTESRMLAACVAVFSLLLFICLVPAFAEDPKPEAEAWPKEQAGKFLAELEARHGGDKSLAAVFDQEKHLKMLKAPLAAKGRICFVPPGRLRFEITQPFASVLLYSTGDIRRFEQENGKWKTLDARAVRVMVLVMEQISHWMQGKFQEQSQVFDTTVAPAPEQRVTVRLRPKHERFREFIEGIDIAVGPPPELRIQAITVREPGGDYTEMRFTREWRGLALPDSVFEVPDAPLDALLADEGKKP